MNKNSHTNKEHMGISGCPRTARQCMGAPPERCPALLEGYKGSAATAHEQVKRLLECRAFLWDVLTGGEWTGCSRELLRKLTALHGPDEVLAAFEKE